MPRAGDRAGNLHVRKIAEKECQELEEVDIQEVGGTTATVTHGAWRMKMFLRTLKVRALRGSQAWSLEP